jgi:hypothetical protein
VLKWVNGIGRWGVISKLYAVLSQLSAEELLAAREVITKRAQDVETSLVIKEAEKDIAACPHCGSGALCRVKDWAC